jgi:hypothetical protein
MKLFPVLAALCLVALPVKAQSTNATPVSVCVVYGSSSMMLNSTNTTSATPPSETYCMDANGNVLVTPHGGIVGSQLMTDGSFRYHGVTYYCGKAMADALLTYTTLSNKQ